MVQDCCMAMLGLTWPATLKRFLPSQGIGMISQVQVKVLKIQVNWSTFSPRRSPGASSSCLGWGILASGRSRQPPSQATSSSDLRGCVSELHRNIERSHFINWFKLEIYSWWFPPFWKATRRQIFPFYESLSMSLYLRMKTMKVDMPHLWIKALNQTQQKLSDQPSLRRRASWIHNLSRGRGSNLVMEEGCAEP